MPTSIRRTLPLRPAAAALFAIALFCSLAALMGCGGTPKPADGDGTAAAPAPAAATPTPAAADTGHAAATPATPVTPVTRATPATPATPAAGAVASAEVGERVFKARCVICHGATGHGDGVASKGLKPQPRNFHDTAYMSSRTDAELLMTIHNGKGAMPAWKGILSETEIASALKYVRAFAKQP